MSEYKRANAQDYRGNERTMSEELIDADIRVARTLPSRFYTEPEQFQHLMSVFSGWQFAAHTSQLEVNTIQPLEHLEAISGESMVLIRNQQTKCVSN
ncbi:MAG: hypothetical protein OR994_08695, partial [Candidatus Poseidoniales archaeon]|nr:hypothetical protein [Candidatus Poseidoniales archaeon]